MSAASAAAAAAATAAAAQRNRQNRNNKITTSSEIQNTYVCHQQRQPSTARLCNSAKRKDWNKFRQYLQDHRPPVAVSGCSGAHVIEYLRYLDQFGTTKVHNEDCPFLGHTRGSSSSCPCPLQQTSASLDSLIGRLGAAYVDNGGVPAENPFRDRVVRLYLEEVRESQAVKKPMGGRPP